MIKSCEDVKTLNDFYEFSRYRNKTRDMGLIETNNMMKWSKNKLIDPELFTRLQKEY